MTDTAMGLLREAVKVIDSLDAIIAGEISNDWADFFGKDWEDMYDIKSRITALLDSGGWVKVDDGLPEKNTTVQVHCGWVDVATYEPKHKRIKSHAWYQEPAGINPNLTVTHWQPLPPLPKG